MMIETKCLILRPFFKKDIPSLAEISASPDVMCYSIKKCAEITAQIRSTALENILLMRYQLLLVGETLKRVIVHLFALPDFRKLTKEVFL